MSRTGYLIACYYCYVYEIRLFVLKRVCKHCPILICSCMYMNGIINIFT